MCEKCFVTTQETPYYEKYHPLPSKKYDMGVWLRNSGRSKRSLDILLEMYSFNRNIAKLPLPPSLTSSLSKQICAVIVFLSVCTCVCICCFVAVIALGRQSAPSLSTPPAHSDFSRVYPPFFIQIYSLITFFSSMFYICSLLITVGRPNCLICPVPGILSRHLHFFQLYLLNIILWKREIFLLWLFRTQNQDLEKTKRKRFKMFSPKKELLFQDCNLDNI